MGVADKLLAQIGKVKSENARLKKEADWLAEIIGMQEDPCVKPFSDNVDCSRVNGCKECWRQAARRSVEANNESDCRTT